MADYQGDADVLIFTDDEIKILVHPGHQPLAISWMGEIYKILDGKDKTLQLYFYSLTWLVPVLGRGDGNAISAALKIVVRILDILPHEERKGAWNMLWDDHAICERLCVLLELMRLPLAFNILGDEGREKVGLHIKKISARLDGILRDDKWKNNNHRIFHLLAAFIHACARSDESERGSLRSQIEEFIEFLIDKETGFSIEQSISYCFFDLVVVKNVIATMQGLSAALRIDAGEIEHRMNSHIAAISFPDGILPASGDTPCGRELTAYQRRFIPRQNELLECWRRLDRIGYHRGCSPDGRIHFLTLSHNGESAHGHASPLHTDIWIEGFGCVLTDSGGPYQYGSRARYDWYRAARGHNSLSLKDLNSQVLKSLDVNVGMLRNEMLGEAIFESTSHRRFVFSYSGSVIFHESVSAKNNWEMYYNFAHGCVVEYVDDGLYQVRRPASDFVINVRTNIDASRRCILETERCIGHAKSVSAASLKICGTPEDLGWFLEFSEKK